MEAWEVLERAAGKIERDGWCQGPLGHSGKVCVGNAISLSHESASITKAAQLLFAAALPKATRQAKARYRYCGRDDLIRIYSWNDAPGRTKEEVIAMLRAVAASLKAARTEATRQHAPESTVAEVATGDATALEHVS